MNVLMKIAYRPVGILCGVFAGMLAGALFKRIWKVAARDDAAPKATDEDRGWVEILLAAAVQGAVFGGVKAAGRSCRRHRFLPCHRRVARPAPHLVGPRGQPALQARLPAGAGSRCGGRA